MSKPIFALARKKRHRWRREQVLKTVRRELDDRGLVDIGLSITPGPVDAIFEQRPGWADTKTNMKEIQR
ncbi:hypothetical protein [Devosia riboflavina]